MERTYIAKALLFSLIGCSLLFSAVARATPLTFSFSDPLGDHTGSVDVIGMLFDFDNSTGGYAITLNADAANPFSGEFRVNINLFNADTGTTADDPSFFSDVFNDFNLASATTQLILSGTNDRLLSWEAGDRVAISGPSPLGVPDGAISFRSAVRDLPDTSLGDVIAEGEFTTIQAAVPEPATLTLMTLGIAAIAGRRRKSRS